MTNHHGIPTSAVSQSQPVTRVTTVTYEAVLEYSKEHSYKQMILPTIEYCLAIIHKLEMIQHRAARFVLNKLWHRNDQDSVSQMLMDLNWPSKIEENTLASSYFTK